MSWRLFPPRKEKEEKRKEEEKGEKEGSVSGNLMSVWGEGERERERERQESKGLVLDLGFPPPSLRSAVTLKMQVVGLRLRGGGYERDFFSPGDLNSIHMRIWNFNTGYGRNIKYVYTYCSFVTAR